MSKFLKRPTLTTGLLAGLLTLSGHAFAGLAGNVVLDFEADDANGAQMAAAVFPSFGQSYIEDGVQHTAIGFGTDPGISIGVTSGGTSHLHGNSTFNGTRSSFLEPDSGGGLFQLLDGDAFSVGGIDVTNLSTGLAGGGASTVTFRGYTSADFSNSVDVTLDAAGIGSHLDFSNNADFGSIYLLEYWFDASGRGNDPSTNAAFSTLGIALDNAEFGAAVTTSPVPVPAAAWLFLSAIGGLGFMRKKQTIAA